MSTEIHADWLLETPVILLGGGVTPNGDLHERNYPRVETTYNALASGAALAILSGGVVRVGYESEAVKLRWVMRVQQSLRQDVTREELEAKIRLEEAARSTRENMAFSKEIVDAEGFDRIALVTDPFHMYRAVMEAKKVYGRNFPIHELSTGRSETLRESFQERLAVFATKAGLK